jgi:hypothetical protein
MPRVGENSRSDGRDHAVDIGDAGAEADQREHVRAAVDQGRPEALEEWEAAVEDYGRGEQEFDPRQNCPLSNHRHIAADDVEATNDKVWPEHAGHRDREQRSSEDHADPESPRHVAQFGIVFCRGGDSAGLEGHAADGTRSGAGAHDLRMHRAGVLGARRRDRDVGFKGHAAGGTGSGLGLADFGAHGAHVGRRASGFRLPAFGVRPRTLDLGIRSGLSCGLDCCSMLVSSCGRLWHGHAEHDQA